MSEIRLKKKRRWPVVLAIILLLIGSIVTYAYHRGYLDRALKAYGIRQEEEHGEETKKDAADQKGDVLIDDKTEEAEGDLLSNTEVTEEIHEDPAKPEIPGSSTSSGSAGSQKKGHWETRYRTEPAWDERVLVKEGYYETVLVSDAWNEEDTYCSAFGRESVQGYECNQCGAQFMTGAEANAHISSSESCGGWHNMTIYTSEEKCLEYRTDYIHHDAVYENVWHDPEYRTVHHAEETVSYQVWIDE